MALYLQTACLGEEDLGAKTTRPPQSVLGQCLARWDIGASRHAVTSWSARHGAVGRVVEDIAH